VIDMMLPLFPLLLLAMAIGSVLVYQHTSNDIFGVLAIASAIVCLIWGLAIAHWSVHVFSLIALFTLQSPLMRILQASE
jgi:hypothetical protein